MDSSVSPKKKSGFCACAITFQKQSTSLWRAAMQTGSLDPCKTWPIGSPRTLVTDCVTSQKSEDLRLGLLVDWPALCTYIPLPVSGYLSLVIRLDARRAVGHFPAGQIKCFFSPKCPDLFWSPSNHPPTGYLVFFPAGTLAGTRKWPLTSI